MAVAEKQRAFSDRPSRARPADSRQAGHAVCSTRIYGGAGLDATPTTSTVAGCWSWTGSRLWSRAEADLVPRRDWRRQTPARRGVSLDCLRSIQAKHWPASSSRARFPWCAWLKSSGKRNRILGSAHQVKRCPFGLDRFRHLLGFPTPRYARHTDAHRTNIYMVGFIGSSISSHGTRPLNPPMDSGSPVFGFESFTYAAVLPPNERCRRQP